MSGEVDNLIEVRVSGEIELVRRRARLWGNLFLTESWTLLIDLIDEPHTYTCDRLRIRESDMLLSGRWEAFPLAIVSTPLRVVFRSSPGADCGKITEDENQHLMELVKRVAIAKLGTLPAIKFVIGSE